MYAAINTVHHWEHPQSMLDVSNHYNTATHTAIHHIDTHARTPTHL